MRDYITPLGGYLVIGYRSAKRRLRMLITGRIEFVGGPLHGQSRRVPRAIALGLHLPRWGAVVEWADGSLTQHWPWSDMPEFDATWYADARWLGNYQTDVFPDHFYWEPSGCERRSDALSRIGYVPDEPRHLRIYGPSPRAVVDSLILASGASARTVEDR